jgi:hypothetical protein
VNLSFSCLTLGFGNDSHGQNATKAASKYLLDNSCHRPSEHVGIYVTHSRLHRSGLLNISLHTAVRACRNATIEFNSFRVIIPGGYDAMKVNVILGVPAGHVGLVSSSASISVW